MAANMAGSAPANTPPSREAKTGNAAANDREIVITRLVHAPRELVWEVFTNPKHLEKWWGPRGFTDTTEQYELRVGGGWKHIMHGPDGTNYPNKSVFREIVKPERIVFSHGGGKEDGEGANFTATWTFEDAGEGKTQVTGRMEFPTAEVREHVVKTYNAIEGGNQNLDRLEEYMALGAASKPFSTSREFNAPRDLVFRVWTEKEHLLRWFAPKGVSMAEIRSLDLRPGGIFHYCMQTADGHKMWGKWTFREIVAPERLMLISSFSDEAGGITRHPASPTWPRETLSRTTLTERNGKTTLTIEWTPWHATAEEQKTFDGAHASMMGGWSGTMDALDAYLASVQ